MIFKDDNSVQIIDTEETDDPICTHDPEIRCMYFDYRTNMYNVQKCIEAKMKDPEDQFLNTFNLNSQSMAFMEIMKTLEEHYECSGGLCDNGDSYNSLAYYVFSNVNDGVPKITCHESVTNLIQGNISVYKMGFQLALYESMGASIIFGLVVAYRFWIKCYRLAKKKDKEEAKKNEEQKKNEEIEIELEQEEQDKKDSKKNESKAKRKPDQQQQKEKKA